LNSKGEGKSKRQDLKFTSNRHNTSDTYEVRKKRHNKRKRETALTYTRREKD